MQVYEDVIDYVRKHIEKTVFLVVLFLFLSYAVFFAVKVIFIQDGYDRMQDIIKKLEIKNRRITSIQKPLKKQNDTSFFTEPKRFSYYEPILLRNVFKPFEKIVAIEKDKPLNPYVLKKIIKQECPLMWKGVMSSSEGTKMFAQININDDTFFVQTGDKLKGYEMLDVNRVYVEVKKNKTGQKFKLDLNKKNLEDKIAAKIYNNRTDKTFTVKVGQKQEGWLVEEIKEEYVRMSKDNLLIYVKGES